MKIQTMKTLVVVFSSQLLTLAAYGQLFPGKDLNIAEPPGVPTVVQPAPAQSQLQQQTHFLTFLGSFVPETAKTASAYYDAIDPKSADPNGLLRDFPHWLVNAGFIDDVGDWTPTGTQQTACDLPDCDWPAGTYGHNIITADAHVLVLNAADLGFVRNQFIRCVPSCSAPNPIIYTYLENYAVAPFAQGGSNFSNFKPAAGQVTGAFPTQEEGKAAIESAITRPIGSLLVNPVNNQPCTLSQAQNLLKCAIERIADVAFIWGPPLNNLASSQRFGQIYAFLVTDPKSNGVIEETTAVPAGSPLLNFFVPDFATNGFKPINQGDPFPPNLDFLGFKQNPGVCLMCHGGKPQALTSTGAYPNGGNIEGFGYLPVDIRNLLFTSDSGNEQPGLPVTQMHTSRAGQELQMKAYNMAVLRTVPTTKENDGTGATRVPHLREVITGWYTDPGGPLFGRTTANSDFIPVGWREPVHGGTAPPGSEHLYTTAFATSCRSCHFKREVSLDFGTAANFKQDSDMLQLALLPDCSTLRPRIYSPDPNLRPMPAVHLTFDKYWQANSELITLPSGQPPLTLSISATAPHIPGTAEQIANYFGFNGTSGYCATNP